MIKILRVGDPHVKVSNLKESEALMEYVLLVAQANMVQRIELLGDLFHTHAVLRLEVIRFWEKWLDILSNTMETVVLEGNHDQSGDYNSDYSALSIFHRLNKPNLKIITQTTVLGTIGYIPYMHDNEKFLKWCNWVADFGVQTLVVHQTLQGSKYESGFYASDGADSEKISSTVKHVISGHIHSQQEFGRVDYPGTARWDSVSDANLPKGIWIYTHDDSGLVLSKEFFSTDQVCSPLYQISFVEGMPEPTIPKGRVTMELIGSSDWISKQKQNLKGKVSIKTRITDQKKTEKRKSGNSLEDFIKNFFNTSKDKEQLVKLAKEMKIA